MDWFSKARLSIADVGARIGAKLDSGLASLRGGGAGHGGGHLSTSEAHKGEPGARTGEHEAAPLTLGALPDIPWR